MHGSVREAQVHFSQNKQTLFELVQGKIAWALQAGIFSPLD
jgi:hypothetical protein